MKIILILVSVYVRLVNSSIEDLFSDIDKINDNDKQPYEIEDLEKIIAFTIQRYVCIQVLIDGSSFSDDILINLHNCNNIRSLVVLENSKITTKECKAFIAIADGFKQIEPLIKFVPLHAANRLVIFVNNNSTEVLEKFLKNNTTMFGDSDIFLVSSSNYTVGYRMGQANKIFRKVQNVSDEWPLVGDNRNMNFRGRTIRVLTFNCSIFSQIGKVDNITGKPSQESGAEMFLFKEIAGRLNMSYVIQVPDGFKDEFVDPLFLNDKWYEKPLQDNSKNGVDIAFCAVLNSFKKRKSQLSMSEHLQLICFRFLVPRPRPIQSEWNSIFKPFDYDLWFTIGIAVGVTTFILQRIVIISVNYVETKGIASYKGLGGAFLQLLSILVLSSVPQSREKQGPSRYLLTCWALFTIIITTSFCSSLSSNLATQLYSPKINTIDEFIDNNYSWLFIKKPDSEEMFNINNTDQARWSVRGRLARSFKDYVSLLFRGRYILWGAQIEKGFLVPFEDHLPTKLLAKYEVSSDCFIQYFTGFAFRVGSSFESPFNKYIQRYRESGLISKILNDLNAKRKKRYPYVEEVFRLTKSTLAGPQGISLAHLVGIFEIWIAGTLLSICVFLLEFCQKFKI